MTVYRTIKSNNFTIISNDIITDKRMSGKAKWILIYALSRPDNWTFYFKDIVNQGTDGKDSIRNGLRELELLGYLCKNDQERDDKGRYGNAEWIFYETPQTFSNNFSEAENPTTGNQTSENPPLLKTKEKKIEERNNNPAPTESPSAVVVPLSLHKLEVNDTFRKKIAKQHTLEDIDIAVERCIKWKARPSDEAGLCAALKNKDDWIDYETQESYLNANKEFLRTFDHLDMQFIGNTKVVVGASYIEFIAGSNCEHFPVEDKDFKKDVNKHLNYIKLVVDRELNKKWFKQIIETIPKNTCNYNDELVRFPYADQVVEFMMDKEKFKQKVNECLKITSQKANKK